MFPPIAQRECGGRIGPEDHVHLSPGLLVDVLVDRARLADHGACLGVGVADLREVLGVVDDYREVDRLAGQAGPAAAVDDRRAELVTGPVGGDDIVQRLGDDDADRDLPVVRGVGGVQRL